MFTFSLTFFISNHLARADEDAEVVATTEVCEIQWLSKRFGIMVDE
jgi:hypothetical protein